jgi:hypothetical protein
MDRTCLTNNILSIQCAHGVLGSGLTTQLSAGSRKSVCLNRYNVATGYLLDILRCYTPFESTVTYAYKFTFTRDLSGSITVALTLKDNVLTSYTGTGTAEEIAIYFQDLINAGGLTVDYLTERVGSVLYVYSYDTAASFTDTTTISSNNIAVVVGSTPLQSNLDEILNLWNSLTENEICNLITYTTKAANTALPTGIGSARGCNC